MKRVSGAAVAGAYRENRILIWVSLVTFENQMGFGAIVPVIALYAQSFGVSQAAIGLSLSVYGFARFLANVPTGQLADRIGRRMTLVLGEVVSIFGNLLCGLAPSFELFLAARFLAGIGGAMVITSSQVIVADVSTKANRGRMLAFYQGFFLFAVGFGPIPGGFLAERFGLNIPFLVFAVLGVFAAITAFYMVPETRGLKGREGSRGGSAAAGGLSYLAQCRKVLSHIGFLLVSLVSFAQFFGRTAAIFAMVPLVVVPKMGISPGELGVAMGIISFANMATVYVSGVLVDRFGRKMVIVPSSLLAGVALVCFALAPDYGWLVATSVLWGVSAGISGPSPAAYAADTAPSGMNATTMSIYRTIADIGYVVGPLLLGWMADLYNGEVSLFFTAVLFVVSGALFGLFAPETAGRKRLGGEVRTG